MTVWTNEGEQIICTHSFGVHRLSFASYVQPCKSLKEISIGFGMGGLHNSEVNFKWFCNFVRRP